MKSLSERIIKDLEKRIVLTNAIKELAGTISIIDYDGWFMVQGTEYKVLDNGRVLDDEGYEINDDLLPPSKWLGWELRAVLFSAKNVINDESNTREKN